MKRLIARLGWMSSRIVRWLGMPIAALLAAMVFDLTGLYARARWDADWSGVILGLLLISLAGTPVSLLMGRIRIALTLATPWLYLFFCLAALADARTGITHRALAARIQDHAPLYDQCARQALRVADLGAMNVCEQLAEDEDGETAFIYDSTDEIAKEGNGISPAWKETALLLSSRAPFGIEGFSAELIGDHIYRVTFAAYADPIGF
jgi:hypothetical protein